MSTLKICFLQEVRKIYSEYSSYLELWSPYIYIDNIACCLVSLNPNRFPLDIFCTLLQLSKRKKAARILCHTDAIPESEIEDTIKEVAKELSVAFEYQLVMLHGDVEVIKSPVLDYLVMCLKSAGWITNIVASETN